MYDTELMMAIVIACTTFIGLTGVVMGQIITSQKPIRMRTPIKIALLISMLIGIATFGEAIGWFEVQVASTMNLVVFLCGFQIGVFTLSAFFSWTS
jgi:hypothetical protein